jgi:succinate dehydrogenase/fumarate reductase flavoprotein subunit
MTTWHEYLQKEGSIPEWPYPIRYGEETEVTTDVLVLGGGIAGCHAAISARRKGVKVAVVDKGPTKWSGDGGAGVDHWLSACSNPCSRISPEGFTESVIHDLRGYDCGPARYINAREAWDALLDCEQMGMKIRDTTDEFKGADFRDEETKLMFAYDYENRIDIRVYGHNVKPTLHREMKRLGVEMYDRVMVTSLLMEGGKPGTRVVGATGVNARTGQFFIFKSKASIIAMGRPARLWSFSTEYRPLWNDMNHTGDALAISWNAGAEFVDLEQSAVYMDNPLGYIPYGAGNCSNTYYGTSIVDANGKEVPWVDRDKRELKTVDERFRPSPGQKFILGLGLRVPLTYENICKVLVPDLSERIRKREFVLPLYADLTRLPEHERRAIFGLMVANEGKTRIPVYDTFTKAGFDPDKDMLQVPVMDPGSYSMNRTGNFWAGTPLPPFRSLGSGGLVADWDLKTNLEGLYAAGYSVFGAGAHSNAATGGRYVGRKAAAYAMTAPEPLVDRGQVEREKARVYAPLKEGKRSIGWKELNIGVCKIMQDYCGEYRSEETLKAGLRLLRELRESEASMVYAGNPHELARALECQMIITVGEMVMHASMARKASSIALNFQRLDFPTLDPPEWQKLLPIRLEGSKVVVRELPQNYHLLSPYAPTYEENYRLHCGA